MRKPVELRTFLEANVPHLKKHPGKLHVFVEKGAVATKLGLGLGFEYRYTLQLIVTDYADPADTLTVPLLVWISTNQHDLIADLNKRDTALAIRAEIIDHNTADIEITLQLSERVLVNPKAGGGFECEHLPEPELPDIGGPTGWTMKAGDLVFAPIAQNQ